MGEQEKPVGYSEWSDNYKAKLQANVAKARAARLEQIRQKKLARGAVVEFLEQGPEITAADKKSVEQAVTGLKQRAKMYILGFVFNPERVKAVMEKFYEQTLTGRNPQILLKYLEMIAPPKEEGPGGVTVIVQTNLTQEASRGPRDVAGEVIIK